jgi:hypothetical protein
MSGCCVTAPIATSIAVTLLEYAAGTKAFSADELRLMRPRRDTLELFKKIGIQSGEGRFYLGPFDLSLRTSNEMRLRRLRTAIGRHREC